MRAAGLSLLRAMVGILAAAYFALALLHVYWAMGGQYGVAGAIPHVDGRPLFRPGRAATLCVAGALAGCGALLLAWINASAKRPACVLLRAALGMLGVVMLARAVGDFRYVGLFKVVQQSTFARMDLWLYTPFCLGAGALLLAAACIGNRPFPSLKPPP